MIVDFYDVLKLDLSLQISAIRVTISTSLKTNYILVACALEISKRPMGATYLLNYNI